MPSNAPFRRALRVLCLALAVISFLTAPVSSSAASTVRHLALSSDNGAFAVPAGFTDSLVASIYGPTAVAFTPDGRILVTSQPGKLRVVQNGNLLSTAAIDFARGWPTSHICANRDRGLLGLAVDPAFSSNHWIYLYYTYNKYNDSTCPMNAATSPVNRVSRFTLPNSNIVATTTEVVLLDNIPSPNGDHNGGDLQFSRNGYLYISVGDGGTGGAPARLRTTLSGKILRIRSDGNIPVGNPFVNDPNAWRCGNPAGGTGTGSCQEVYAYGLRNPFRFAFDPNASGTLFFINDVGQDTWEEIDLGQAGVDYGWNCFEGNHIYVACAPPPASAAPIFEYDHSVGCASVTGGTFVPNGIWPADYQGKYLYADYVCGRIFRLDPNGAGGYTPIEFSSGLGGVTTLRFGPYAGTQALYYLTYANGGQLRRISNTPAPVAAVSASPTTGRSPLAVHFDGSASSDPGGSPLTYDWAFGDSAMLNGSLSATTTHTYTVTGNYTATLVVRNGAGLASAPAHVNVWVNNALPQPMITSPVSGTTFTVGQVITAAGQATDAEDGAVPPGSLSWEVRLHHIDEANPANAHWHPYANASGVATMTFPGPAPEDLTATALSYLEIRLTATDSAGQSTTVSRTIQPRRIKGNFVTNPAGLQLMINGLGYTMPRQFTLWEAWSLNLSAPLSQTDGLGQQWNFVSWSDGGAANHTAVAPAAPITYTAEYQTDGGGPDLIFADGFESGGLTAWSSRTVDGGDLSASSAAALVGSVGLQAVLDDNVAIYLTDERPANEAHYRARFYFDPNTIGMTSGDAHFIFHGYALSGTTATAVLRVEFRFESPNYQLRMAALNDSGTWVNTAWATITDARHVLELDWRAATAAGANNGELTFWLDSVQKANLTTIDNDARRVDRVRLGAVGGLDSGTRGTYFLDAFESRRQSYIGP